MPLDIDITKTLTYKQAKKVGEIKGKTAGKLEIAEAMLIDGMPVAQIQKFTKLSLAQINSIKDKIKE